MKISPTTKISAVIKANPAAIDAIASINRHFEKLRNPLLRKILAPRVTIADAARIGGTEVAVFLDTLMHVGFEVDQASPTGAKGPEGSTTPTPDLPTDVVPLDVREMLQQGQDPFQVIMGAIQALQPRQALLLINLFEPSPLFPILAKKGYAHYTETKGPNLVHTYFYRQAEAGSPRPPAEIWIKSAGTFQDKVGELRGNLRELDVRDLEMPLPMTTVLETLTQLHPEQTLLIHHRRVPQFLLPELRERGYSYMIEEMGPEQVQILVFKTQPHEPAARP